MRRPAITFRIFVNGMSLKPATGVGAGVGAGIKDAAVVGGLAVTDAAKKNHLYDILINYACKKEHHS